MIFPIANPPSPLSVPRAIDCSAPSSRPYEMEMGSHPGLSSWSRQITARSHRKDTFCVWKYLTAANALSMPLGG